MSHRGRIVGILVLGSLTLAACGTVSASTALGRWTKSSDLTSAVAQLTSDARHALTELELTSASTKELHTVCSVLDFETLQANASLPTPDTQTTNLLSAAYTDLGSGANECYAAGPSPSKRRLAITYLRRAGAELAEAEARVGTVTGSS